SGKPVSLLDLISLLGEVSGREPRIRFLPERLGDVRESWADIERARRMLGIVPGPLREGLRKVIESI
ncbi:NAD-dependent dehydratase, partial [Candidatus Bipolaricaulota bacterium]|nr:NAD-dependent dehydratase [Candidatus Bipolaricaulota bacterium]